FPSKLAFALGKDIAGNNVVVDLGKMPHLLIAGATGSGKSVCINTLITSIIYKADPNEVKLLMVDPKVVELNVYNGIPHLMIPVVTDPRRASGALYWAVQEMTRRYAMFAEANVRDIKGYNEMIKEEGGENTMPHIVIIIDELADLMMVAPGEVEDSICRLAQMARAAGMHLVIATQRPSVDVITGIIKANIPSRIAFAVSSQVDSRTILDAAGADKLLGRGDMLFAPVGSSKPTRLQGAFISDKEVERVVEFIKKGSTARYDEDIMEKIENGKTVNVSGNDDDPGDSDELLPRAIEIAVDTGKISASYLQRRLKIGFSRAARIVDQMEERGWIGPPDGSKPREVPLSKEDYLEMSVNS
ncbi:MAG: DNA translocase FtsK, partial [Clostridia bacterium]|nr:DNA translocase FtsK [Clostridia bacterium]